MDRCCRHPAAATVPALLLAVACSRAHPAGSELGGNPPAQPVAPLVHVTDAFPRQASFVRPVLLATAPEDPDHAYVVELAGRIWKIPRNPALAERTLFFDGRTEIHTGGLEEGLLGFAFDPDHARNSFVYLFHSHGLAGGQRQSLLVRYAVENGVIAAGTRLVLLRTPAKSFANHNGGTIVFGPDRMLYLALGDGGGGGDPLRSGQDLGVWFGKILRLDVAGATSASPYRVPPDNPFVGLAGARPEIWAYGLRNPWRIHFDRLTGDLWYADVGQDSWEEVGRIHRGGNHGWNVYEGAHPFPPDRQHGPPAAHVAPIAEYSHAEGQSVTGGAVYRGKAIPELIGACLYGDWASGRLWAVREQPGLPTQRGVLLLETGKQITAFAEEPSGEVLLVCFDGRILRLEK